MDESELAKFWNIYDKKNKIKEETQIDRYIRNGANKHIIRFIELGGGPKLGCIVEKCAKNKFNLDDRIKGDTSHDHTIKYKDNIIKIEQKTSTLNKTDDLMWQHISPKHKWNILLFVGIKYKEIVFFGMNRYIFNKLVNEGKITNQGNKNKDNEQGMWCKYSNIKNDLIEIKTNEDIILLYNNDKINDTLIKSKK